MVLGCAAFGITILRGSHTFSGFGGFGGFDDKRRQIEQLEKDNEALQREIAARRNRLTNLQQNPDELKLEIERRLKLVSPGTKQFILQDGTTGDKPEHSSEPRP
jgi:cell division protein FtsB